MLFFSSLGFSFYTNSEPAIPENVQGSKRMEEADGRLLYSGEYPPSSVFCVISRKSPRNRVRCLLSFLI